MAWSISHTQEAWDNVRHTLAHHWSAQQLVDALVDCRMEANEGEPEGQAERAAEGLRYNLRVYVEHNDTEALADLCVKEIRKHMTCDNGGFCFYIDPWGIHQVSVDRTCDCPRE